LFAGEDVCLIFCEPRQQDVVDLLCSLSASHLCKEAPADLVALALSRLQPSATSPTWQLEEKYTIVPVTPLIGEEETKSISGIPTSVILKRREDTTGAEISCLNIKSCLDDEDPEPNLTGDISAGCSDQDRVNDFTTEDGKKSRRDGKRRANEDDADWDGEEEAKKPRKRVIKKGAASNGSKKAGTGVVKTRRYRYNKGNGIPVASGTKTRVDGGIKAEAVEEADAENDLNIQESNAQRFANLKVAFRTVPVLIGIHRIFALI
jgi:hypothetical protein